MLGIIRSTRLRQKARIESTLNWCVCATTTTTATKIKIHTRRRKRQDKHANTCGRTKCKININQNEYIYIYTHNIGYYEITSVFVIGGVACLFFELRFSCVLFFIHLFLLFPSSFALSFLRLIFFLLLIWLLYTKSHTIGRSVGRSFAFTHIDNTMCSYSDMSRELRERESLLQIGPHIHRVYCLCALSGEHRLLIFNSITRSLVCDNSRLILWNINVTTNTFDFFILHIFQHLGLPFIYVYNWGRLHWTIRFKNLLLLLLLPVACLYADMLGIFQIHTEQQQHTS